MITLGYADGLLRAGGASDDRAGGAAIVAGKRCPIVGRISMDLVCIDITDLPEGAVRRGDFATMIAAFWRPVRSFFKPVFFEGAAV